MSLPKSMTGLHILSPVFTLGKDTSSFFISAAFLRVINGILNRYMIPAIIVIQQQQQNNSDCIIVNYKDDVFKFQLTLVCIC